MAGKSVKVGIVVDDVYIPAGCDIGCSIYAVHQS